MKNIVLLFVLISILGCKANMKNASTEKINIETESMEASNSNLIAKGKLYGSGEEGIDEQNLVITKQSDWKDLMLLMNSVNEVTKSFSETEIDFEKYNVIAVFDKVRNSGGYGLDLNIETKSGEYIVNIIKTRPEGYATAVMTQPYCIVKITKSDTPIRFK